MMSECHTEKKKRPRDFFAGFSSIFIIVLIVAAYFIGVREGRGDGVSGENRGSLPVSNILSKNKGEHPDLSLFWKTWDALHSHHVDRDSLDDVALVYGAVKGMLAATGDPYTVFFDPEENKSFEEDLAGSFDGIGAEIGMKDDILTVVAPLDGSPAERAGLRAGDKVLKVDGAGTADMTIDQAVKRMRGAKGTEVVLTIFRDGDVESKDIAITRDTITVKTVKSRMESGDIAVITLSQFGEETVEEFEMAIDGVLQEKPRGLILDLRNDPGGLLDSAIAIGSHFLPKGSVVVIEEDEEKNRRSIPTKGGGVFSEVPMVVLLNGGSASAAEILAGALRENRDDVVLVGERSFGKGSVQELLPITKDTSLKVTVARWLTPDGNQINEKGITPDIEIPMTNEDYEAEKDPQFDRALEIIREKIGT